MTLLLAIACTGKDPVVPDTAQPEADADADADSDSDTDVVKNADSGILDVYWEGSFSDTFVGTHSIVAYYERYANDGDSTTDPYLCVYSWDTVASSTLSCDSCEFAFTVTHSGGAPSSTSGCKNTLQLGSFGVDLDDRGLGFAASFVTDEQTYNNVLVEFLDGAWTYAAPATWDGTLLEYRSPVSYYYY